MLDSNYIGEIRMYAGTYAPSSWKFCDGSLLSISENDTLFALIGTTYGGDGQSTFAIPDLRGRVPVHVGTGSGLSPVMIGEKAGKESVTMSVGQMPAHNHLLMAQLTEGNANTPANNAFADTGSADPDFALGSVTPDVVMGNQSVSLTGNNTPISINQPSLAINYIIALAGIFPTPS